MLAESHRMRLALQALLLAQILLLSAIGSAAQIPQTEGEDGRYIVILREPPVGERILESAPPSRGLRAQLRRAEPADYSSAVLDSQRAFVARLSGTRPGDPAGARAVVLGTCSFLLNAVFVSTTEEAAAELRNDPEVRGVYRSQPRWPTMDAAPEILRAAELWNLLGGVEQAGRGVKIAIIDSGINQNHPMFRDDGMEIPPGFPRGDPGFTNGKVIAARSFPDLFPARPTQPEDRTPEDQLGHGSRVAGVAAGRRTEAELAVLEGIAPQAYLGNYKVFGRPPNDTTTSVAVIAAIDQAVQDGMDIINLSLGGPATDPVGDPEQEAIARATRLGVIVVVAAGNNGPEAATVSSPGTSADAITVGAVSHGRSFSPALDLNAAGLPSDLARVPYTAGAGVTITSDLGPLPLATLTGLDSTQTACVPLPPASLTQKMVLVRRGDCFFQVKADNVFAAGAAAMVVYNNVGGPSVIMSFTQVPGPSVMIDQVSGERLSGFADSTPLNSVFGIAHRSSDLFRFSVPGDEIADFSGRGPNIDGSVKPDLVAIGSGVYTASNDESRFSLNSSGTSFATPMVSGGAALLRQLHPTWPPEAIKSALVSTAIQTPTLNNQGALVMQMGSGRLDLFEAAGTSSTASPVSLSFGFLTVEQLEGEPETKEIVVTNRSGAGARYRIEYDPAIDNASVQLSVSPSDLSLAGGASAPVELTADFRGSGNAGFFEGFLRLVEEPSGAILSVPVWGALLVEDASVVLSVAQSGGAQFSDLSSAFRAAQPGNVIEILDSGIYRFSATVHTNEQGLPLNGLTIRGSSTPPPTIDGSSLTGNLPVLKIEGIERVTIEGLHIKGGASAVQFENAGGTIRGCLLEGDPDLGTGYGISSIGGRVHIYDNRIVNTGGSALSLIAGTALIQGNVIGEPGGQSITAGHGIQASSSEDLAIFDNRIHRAGSRQSGQGIRLSGSTALVKGNWITDGRSAEGDGILVRSSFANLDARSNRLTGNERNGIKLQEGATAQLTGNRLERNHAAGLAASGDSVAEVRRLESLDNQYGILLNDSRVSLYDSLIAFSQVDGIWGTAPDLEVTNSTIAQNGGAGIRLADPGEIALQNSIFAGNGVDLSGVPAASTRFNLFDATTPLGGAANLFGDPLFQSPVAGDFNLSPGSAAIDRGDNEAVTQGLDLVGHSRVTDGNSDGTPVVDLGAFESSSDFAPLLLLPRFAAGSASFQGVALANVRPVFGEDTTPLLVVLDSHGPAGSNLAAASVELPEGTQISRLLSELISGDHGSWLGVRGTAPDIVGFTLAGNTDLTVLDGIPLGRAEVDSLVLTEPTLPDSTRLIVINPGTRPLPVRISRENNGPAEFVDVTLAPQGLYETLVSNLFRGPAEGYLRVISLNGEPIWAAELFGGDDALAGLVGLSAADGDDTLFGAQLAWNSAIETIINVVNLGPAGTLRFDAVGENGTIIESKSIAMATRTHFRGKASELFETSEFVGWLRVETTGGQLVGSLAFGDPAGQFLAALPLQSAEAGAREFVLSHVAEAPNIFTGVTVLNPSDKIALVSLEVFDPAGNKVGVAFHELGPRSKRASLLREWVPGLDYQLGGFIRVRSNVGIMGFELFGSDSYLAAVPQQTVVH